MLVEPLDHTPMVVACIVEPVGVTHRASAKAVDVGGYTLDFSARGQTASRFVDFAMFGAGGKLVQ